MLSNSELRIFHLQPMRRSEVLSNSKLEIFHAHLMRRRHVSSNEDEVR